MNRNPLVALLNRDQRIRYLIAEEGSNAFRPTIRW